MSQDTVSRVPQHVSIIMDGNGRWAKERGLERTQGHLQGVTSVKRITEAAVDAGVKYLSLYTFSEENWNRPEKEVAFLMNLTFKAISDYLETMMKNGVRFIVLGNRSRLPKDLDEAISETERITASGTKMALIVFLSYSGKWDILHAAKALAKQAAASGDADSFLEGFGEEDFGKLLVTSGIPDPDLIIRTSGEERLSNYLLWQGAYSEFYFTKVLWPDFGEEEFREALRAYASRDRRYGKVK